jgi:hypothetical protein
MIRGLKIKYNWLFSVCVGVYGVYGVVGVVGVVAVSKWGYDVISLSGT